MKRSDFLICSVAFHIVLIIVIFLLPSPFPSPKGHGGTIVVELKASGREKNVKKRPKKGISIKEEASASHDEDVHNREYNEGRPGNHIIRKMASLPPETPAKPPVNPPLSAGLRPLKQPEKPQQTPKPPLSEDSTARARAAEEPPVEAARLANTGIKADRDSINFKYQKGWPVPSMVRLRLSVPGADKGITAGWRADADCDWLIVAPAAGLAPCQVKIGVDTTKMAPGFYGGRLRFIQPGEGPGAGAGVDVSVMVLPAAKGTVELPHSSWDSYMDGSCKVCHLPEGLMPTSDFMLDGGFCALCHNRSAMAKDKIPGPGGHPMMALVGSGGTKMPTFGSVPSGPKSDRMATHLKDRKIVCVTCHNVMEKPHDYGRAWEMTSSDDGRDYYLYKGGWENMGYIVPKVYVTEGLIKMPRQLKELKKYEAAPDSYRYDASEGVISFLGPMGKADAVYVTLTEPYLRVSTRDNALCYDCHNENTHEGMNCLVCHKMHGTTNKKAVRDVVITPDGDAVRTTTDGICEVCHPVPRSHRKYTGTDCIRCHPHSGGFSR